MRVGEGTHRGSVLYPDVGVDRQSGAGDARVTTTALVVVEVLSPSTDLAHHLRKFERYKRVDTLVTYIVFEQKAPLVRMWRKSVDGWPPAPTIVSDPAAYLDLPEIGARIGLADVYRKPSGVQP